MSDVIESGAISDLFKDLFNSIFKDFKRGLKFEDARLSKDGKSKIFTVKTGGNNRVQVKLVRDAKSSLYDIYILGDNGSKLKKEKQPENKVEDIIVKFIDDEYGELLENPKYDESTDDEFEEMQNADFEDLEESQHIQIQLSKVQGSKEIQFGPIFCNYDEMQVYEDLENVLDNEEFINGLSEEPQCYAIIPQDDEYDIKKLDSIQEMNCANRIINLQIITILDLMSKINSNCDENFKARDRIWSIRNQLDWMLDSNFADNVDLTDINFNPTNDDVDTIIDRYTTELDLYYPNFPHEIQKLIDEWLLTLKYRH